MMNETRGISDDLQRLQRQKVWYRKSRIMVENRLRATVAGSLGYESRMPEKERAAKFREATKLIKAVLDGEQSHELDSMIRTTAIAIDGFGGTEDAIEKTMVKLAKSLPVSGWVDQPEQRGFGLSSLATLIGETGDLSLYPNPGKVWRRMGCAPYQSGEKTLMGATWRGGREGKLSAAEWEAFGYSPRRRSIAFVIGEGLIKQNFMRAGGDTTIETEATGAPGPYRARYDFAKAALAEKNPDYKPLRCHRHGMLLATKLLMKNLWIEWRCEGGDCPVETEVLGAALASL